MRDSFVYKVVCSANELELPVANACVVDMSKNRFYVASVHHFHATAIESSSFMNGQGYHTVPVLKLEDGRYRNLSYLKTFDTLSEALNYDPKVPELKDPYPMGCPLPSFEEMMDVNSGHPHKGLVE